MKYALAKELKDNGFPQGATNGERGLFPPERSKEKIPAGEFFELFAYSPTLSELIEACGKNFACLEHLSNELWVADAWREHGFTTFSKEGPTPEEAVARLWLALNKK